MNNHTYIVSRGLLFAAILFAATLSFSACGVKNGYVVGEYGKYPLSGEIIAAETNDSSQAVKGTMSLLWQGDSLRITLNQGRQLLRAKTGKDTLYLYEAPRGAESDLQAQAANDTTRQYTFYIPTRELFIIKYNGALVYPVMPTTEPCEYPLEIKVMGRKIVNEYEERERERERIKEEMIKQGTYRGGGVLDMSLFPFEFWEGTYLYNAGAYQLGSDCECETDSSNVLVLHIDGTWQRYRNNILQNCGIMRKSGSPDCYEMDNYNHETVFFLDTASIAGHVISLREDTRRWKENIPYQRNEYRWVGKGKIGCSFMFVRVYSLQEDSIMKGCFFIPGRARRFFYEGTRCGWQGKIRNIDR